jgi:hypothetical protein
VNSNDIVDVAGVKILQPYLCTIAEYLQKIQKIQFELESIRGAMDE